MRGIEHFVLTRFNVRVAWMNDRLPDREWLENRFTIFERYCLPSVMAQENTSFHWLVFFDAGTPREYRDRIASYGRVPMYQPVYLEEFTLPALHDIIRGYLKAGAARVLTTRLDNDDALGRQYVARVQQVATTEMQRRAFISIARGYVHYGGHVYYTRYVPNAFVSLVEHADDVTTGYAYSHHKIASYAPVRVIDNYRGWMQVVHGRNLRNRAQQRTLRARVHSLGGEFPAELLHGRDETVERFAANASYCVRSVIREGRRAYGRGRTIVRMLKPGAGAPTSTRLRHLYRIVHLLAASFAYQVFRHRGLAYQRAVQARQCWAHFRSEEQ